MSSKQAASKQDGRSEKASAIPGGGSSMRSRLATILGAVMVVALAFVWNSCGSQPGCPTCGTTTNGAYGVIDVIPVPEHNPTGEPGGPFNSFDISWFDPNLRRVYTSDRIGLAIVVTDSVKDEAVNVIEGLNGVTQAGNLASSCLPGIPSIITGAGALRNPANFNILTRFGCRNGNNPGATAAFFNSFGTFFPGFGANGGFGGFPGAQCCASRANGVNPISGPDGNLVTPDGKTLFVGSGSASVVAFDLTSNPPTVLADFPTGSSPDFDGPAGVAPCIATWNGGAGSDPTCADDRADEMAYGTVKGVDILEVNNGDPGLPFATFVDVTAIVTRAAAGMAAGGYCLPSSPLLNYNPGNPATTPPTGHNYPTCILGQIYYDGAPGPAAMTANVTVDSGVVNTGIASAPCPDQSTAVASGVSGTGVGAGGADVPCHHAPIVDINTGAFITNSGVVTAATAATQQAEFAVAGTGASAFNPIHGTFYVQNLNCTASNLATQSTNAVGCIDEIDPRIGVAGNPGPIVINVVPTINCMPAGMVQGPGNDFLVGCGGHDGTQFPPLLIIFDGSCTSSAACTATFTNITQSGGTDEVWYNSGDNKYYTAGRDMPNGPIMGVVDAGRRVWLVNVPTGSNSHSIAVDNFNNHIFVPLQAGARCTTQSSNGCIGVYAQQ
jgi:hypothetical protein